MLGARFNTPAERNGGTTGSGSRSTTLSSPNGILLASCAIACTLTVNHMTSSSGNSPVPRNSHTNGESYADGGASIPGSMIASLHNQGLPQPFLDSHPVSQIGADSAQVFRLNDLPRGTTIIIGSLDREGRNHQVRIASGSDARSAPEENAHAEVYSYADVSAAEQRMATLRKRANVTSVTTPCAGTQVNPFITSFELTTSAAVLPEHRYFLLPIIGDAASRSRVTSGRLTAATDRVAVYNAESVRLTNESEESSRNQRASRLIADLLENYLLDAVHNLIGEVEDVDRNNHLTVVLTDLRTASAGHEAGVPVVACVRSSDLLDPEGPFSGDIIYLDRSFASEAAGPPTIPSADDSRHRMTSVLGVPVVHSRQEKNTVSRNAELRAILSHELAHAAANSALLRHRITNAAAARNKGDEIPRDETVTSEIELPDWLNEAIAHSIEYHLAPDSENLARRFDAFRSTPEQSPIFATDPSMPYSLRRSGCRAAAVSFLNHSYSDSGSLQSLLRTLLQFEHTPEERLQTLHSVEFPEAFRKWCVRLGALQIQRRNVSLSGVASVCKVPPANPHCEIPTERAVDSSTETTIQLRGTAAAWYRTTSDRSDILITASSSAQLQVSVLSHSSRPADSPSLTKQPSAVSMITDPRTVMPVSPLGQVLSLQAQRTQLIP
ncbi:MAG: hypothetical protein ACK526_21885 [Planctomyces sp.]|jgi:hypothetical protein